ncbi:MAG: phospholipase D-like domain-containing protein [Geminicoccaceae bacterium]
MSQVDIDRRELHRLDRTRQDAGPQEAEPQDAVLDQAFSRITGSRLVAGNGVRLLLDAAENYPAWLTAIAAAGRTVHFENYIIADDEVGRSFAQALAERARAGVTVRLLYDWWGCLGKGSRRLWAELRRQGVEVRVFNPPQPMAPLACLRRDHRKVLTVDGEIAFVSGLCLAKSWLGEPERGIPPWRDTGVELRGPVVADVEAAFVESWRLAGGRVPPHERSPQAPSAPAGPIKARVVRGRPGQLSTYRLDQLVAAAARETLWLTDAYFMATTGFVQALTEANRDGVDVRLLVPGSNDVMGAQTLVRSGYRPLLEAGIRIFEWNGSMLHAKTAVCDGQWVRIGSTNLNLTGWLTNWELDLIVEDAEFARQMEAVYREDLAGATEIVLDRGRRIHAMAARRRHWSARAQRGSGGRLARGAVGLGSTAGAAITGSRPLSAMEGGPLVKLGLTLLVLALLLTWQPLLIAVPMAVALAWLGTSLLYRVWGLRRGR